MLVLHFGIRPEEYPGFEILFNRVSWEMGFNLDKQKLIKVGDSWLSWGEHRIYEPLHVKFPTMIPMVTLQSMAELFAVYFEPLPGPDHEGRRIIVTDENGNEFVELQW